MLKLGTPFSVARTPLQRTPALPSTSFAASGALAALQALPLKAVRYSATFGQRPGRIHCQLPRRRRHAAQLPPPAPLPQVMCGRTRVSLAPDQVLRAAGTARWVNREAYQPSYNVSPGSATPVVVAGGPDGVQVQTMR